MRLIHAPYERGFPWHGIFVIRKSIAACRI